MGRHHGRNGWLWPAGLAMLLLAASAPLSATPPTLSGMDPRGAERGKVATIAVSGANLTPHTRLILPFPATVSLRPDPKLNPALVRFQLTIDAAVPLGIYPVRVATEDGISSFVLFSVDAFPNVNEVEDNSTFDKAQKVPIPVIITGQCPGGDVDFFRFSARKGQRLNVETEAARLGSAMVPQIRVTDAARRLIAADDSQAIHGDCRVSFLAPTDGDYVVEISDTRYRGGNPAHYRLKIAEYDVIEEVFPLGGRRGASVAISLRGGGLPGVIQVTRTMTDPLVRGFMALALDGEIKPGMLSPQLAVGDLPERLWSKPRGKDPRALDVLPPLTINSRLDHPGDSDRFQFAVQAGQGYRIAVQAEALGSSLDGVLRVTDQAGKQLALVDDVDLPPPAPGQATIRTADPVAEVTVPADTTLLGVELRDQRRRGGMNFGYRLTIEPIVADFSIQQIESEVNVARGGAAVLTVPVLRRGYQGPLQLGLATLPPGLAMQGGHVPAGATQGFLTLTAPPQAPPLPAPLSLQIEGKTVGSRPEIRRLAKQRIVLSQEADRAACVLTLSALTVDLTGQEPFAVHGPATFDLVMGYPSTVPFAVTRLPNQSALAIEVTALAPPSVSVPGQPPGPAAVAIKAGTAAAGAATAPLTITAALSAPEGTLDLVPQAKAKINNADKVVSGSAVAVNVHKPFLVELTTPNLTLAAGQTAALKGRIVRQAVFKEAVQLKLDGLPAGVALATPLVPVAGTANEFQIMLKADPKAAAAITNLTLTCSTTIAGMAYAHPAVTVPLQAIVGK